LKKPHVFAKRDGGRTPLIGESIRNKKRPGGSMTRLADHAAEEIRRMVMQNQFSPWEPLSEFHLAQMLNISRTPVREAITQLEQEGLLKVVPGKGAFVIELTKDDFREVNSLRLVLEPLAAETAIHFIPMEEVIEQKALWTKIAEDLRARRDLSAEMLAESDDRLHWLFIDHCDNSRLRNFLGVLRCQMGRYVRATWETRVLMEETAEQHLEILRAVEEKNVQNLLQALARHIDFNNTVFAYHTAR
jgi:DNA-binding GntR family transcriptional regulator